MRLWFTGSWRGGQSQRLDRALFELKALFSTCQTLTLKNTHWKKMLGHLTRWIYCKYGASLSDSCPPSQCDAILSKLLLHWKNIWFPFWHNNKMNMLSFCEHDILFHQMSKGLALPKSDWEYTVRVAVVIYYLSDSSEL